MNEKDMNVQEVTRTIPENGFASGLKELKKIVEGADENTIIRVIFTEDEPDEGDGAEEAD